MQDEIEKAVLAGTLTPQAAKALETLPPGAYCLHKSWGFGRIASLNLELNQIVVDFKSKKGHLMQPQYAAESLTPLPDNHILVRKVTETAALKTQAKEDPGGLVRSILKNYEGRATQDQISHALSGEIFNDAEFKRW
ncbi:MAG TPA: hypothetical protein VNQ90_10485, partial [Chthoniobacteraceae bacterium]|nr:hypothetical protein [Chthoniobacteraceae bacterium]